MGRVITALRNVSRLPLLACSGPTFLARFVCSGMLMHVNVMVCTCPCPCPPAGPSAQQCAAGEPYRHRQDSVPAVRHPGLA